MRPPEAASSPRPYGYRPALDGLRAIAVLGVMLYHARVEVISGGFLGVDLFFVLSGYLITTLLLREWQGSGSIDLGSFWVRRGRRLLPALFLILAAVLLYGSIATATELQRLRGDAFATLAYVANWWYAVSGESYFEQFARPSMLRHTWSLAIEEQFYFLWPLLMSAGLWLAGSSLRFWLVASLAGAAMSAGAMWFLFDPTVDPSRVYYGTDTRAQALLVGAALAFLLERLGDRSSGRLPTVVGTCGLLVCIALFHAVEDSDGWMYRGGYLLMALASAGAITAAAVGDNRSLIVRILAGRPLVWVGARSYGLYLWHWPVFVFLDPARTGMEQGSWPLLLTRMLVTVVVSMLSYRFVEVPIRSRALRPVTELRILAASAAALVVAIPLVTIALAPEPEGLAAVPEDGIIGELDPGEPGALRVLVVGDSVAATLASQRPRTAGGVDLSVLGNSLLGCGVVTGRLLTTDRGLLRRNRKCEKWLGRWAKAAAEFRPDVSVVLVGAWEVFDRLVAGQVLRVGSPGFADYLEAQLKRGIEILARDGRPVVLLTSPCFNAPDDGILVPWQERNDPGRVDAVNESIRRVAIQNPDTVALIDLHAFVCPAGEYQPVLQGVTLHSDGSHYTQAGAHLVWTWLAPQLAEVAGGR